MVNALHVITRDVVTGLPLADVVLASADAHVQCQSSFAWSLRRLDFLDTVFAQTEPAQFTTGGGWIPGNVGDKGTFGFVAGVQADGTLTGHVVYIDHSVNFGIESTQITAFTPGCTTNIGGTATTSDGSSVRFHLTVQDNGEPGRHDTFDIQVTDDIQYANGNVLGGGNIQADGTFAGGRVLSHGPSCL